jgi:hypothetical protein
MLPEYPTKGVKEADGASMMEKYPSHITVEVMDLLPAARVQVTHFAPQTMQIFQSRDLTPFGIFKRKGKDQIPFGNLATMAGFEWNVDMNMAKILTGANKSTVFQTINGEFDMSTTPYRVVCQEKKLKKSEKLVEL